MKKRLVLISILLCILCFPMVVNAGNFVNSVQQKPVPKPVISEDTGGGSFWGVSKSDTVPEREIPVGSLIMTSLDGSAHTASGPVTPTGRDAEVVTDAQKKLLAAYEEIKAAEDLAEVFGNPLTEGKDYTVSHLFDLAPAGMDIDTLKEEFAKGHSLTLSFQFNIPLGTEFYISTKCGEEWIVLDRDQVVNNGDGTVTVTFYDVCPIAVIQLSKNVTSPKTMDMTPDWNWGTGIMLLAATFVFLVGFKKCSLK